MTEYIIAGYANANTFVSLVDESKVGGRICGIGISRARKEHHFQIKLDGRNIHDVGHYQQATSSNIKNLQPNYFAYSDAPEAHNALTLDFEFENQLEVKIKDGRGTWPDTKFWAAYEVDDDTESGEEPVIADEETEIEDGLVFTNRYFEESDREQTIYGGSEHISNVRIEKDVFSEGEEINAELELANWKGEQVQIDEIEHDPKLVLKPEGRETPIDDAGISSDYVNTDEPINTGLALEQPGEYEVAADIDDVANFSTSFSVRW